MIDPHPPAARAAPPGPGEAYGPYRLVRRVAAGGMAEVFQARQGGIGGFEKVMAVKRILPHLARNKELVELFVNEAKLVAPLSHPNIVQIFDLGRIEGSYYIAMEYVHGRDLRTVQHRVAERGLRIPLDLSMMIVGAICSALAHAHHKKDERGRAMGIVHRDVSPQNILLSFEGEVKLADFGIAKAAAKATATDPNVLRGKLLYMSPEQARGRPADARSDIFSLGLVFYELLTERRALQADSETAILEKARSCRVAPPRSINPRIPESLERVVMKALHPDADERYQDGLAMHRALDRAFADRRPATGRQLTRFLDILFDADETGAGGAAEGELGPAGASHLEIDLTPSGAGEKKKPSALPRRRGPQ